MSLVTPIYGSNSTAQLNSGGTTGSSEIDQDQFLSLLVAQMNYQDPLSPLDSQQFASQLAQFTSLEQLTQMNDNLEQSLQAQILLNQSINNTMSAQLMGFEVNASNDIVQLEDGEATSIMYELPGSASEVTLTIKDGDGNTVKTLDLGMKTAGEYSYQWDGTNDIGANVPEGDYYFSVEAKTPEGNNLTVNQYIVGVITGVTFEDGQAVLKIGNLPVYLSNVTSLSLPPEQG